MEKEFTDEEQQLICDFITVWEEMIPESFIRASVQDYTWVVEEDRRDIDALEIWLSGYCYGYVDCFEYEAREGGEGIAS